MTVQTSAGAKLGISATKPTTFDATGYAALTMTTIGEITDLGQFGRKYNVVKHNPISSRGTQKLKGSYDEGTVTLKLGLDNKDAGQLLCMTALNADSDYSFNVILLNGDKYFFQAKVIEFMVGVNTVDTVTNATIMLEITTTSTGVGVVTVPTP